MIALSACECNGLRQVLKSTDRRPDPLTSKRHTARVSSLESRFARDIRWHYLALLERFSSIRTCVYNMLSGLQSAPQQPQQSTLLSTLSPLGQRRCAAVNPRPGRRRGRAGSIGNSQMRKALEVKALVHQKRNRKSAQEGDDRFTLRPPGAAVGAAHAHHAEQRTPTGTLQHKGDLCRSCRYDFCVRNSGSSRFAALAERNEYEGAAGKSRGRRRSASDGALSAIPRLSATDRRRPENLADSGDAFRLTVCEFAGLLVWLLAAAKN